MLDAMYIGVNSVIEFMEKYLVEFGDISLQEAIEKIKKRSISPEECRFTGIVVNTICSCESAGEVQEFSGTIAEILETLEVKATKKDELVNMFLDHQKWTMLRCDKQQVYCVPMDRALSKEEVEKVLEELL